MGINLCKQPFAQILESFDQEDKINRWVPGSQLSAQALIFSLKVLRCVALKPQSRACSDKNSHWRTACCTPATAQDNRPGLYDSHGTTHCACDGGGPLLLEFSEFSWSLARDQIRSFGGIGAIVAALVEVSCLSLLLFLLMKIKLSAALSGIRLIWNSSDQERWTSECLYR